MSLKNLTQADGSFKRQVSSFRNAIAPTGKFAAEQGRYHLYVSLGCPWAHRTLIVRQLKKLETFIDVSVVHPNMGEEGWKFDDSFKGSTVDHVNSFKLIREVYFKADPDYNARFTVPVVWDKQNATIVNNESSEIIRFLNTAFNELLPKEAAELDLYPEALRAEIDELNEWVYDTVNNGVYKSGFASTAEKYKEALVPLFKSLDRLEELLSDGRVYLIGGQLTEADVRLYTTIVRFDVSYHGLFKCNLGSIRHDYPHLNKWLKNLYWNNPAFKDTTDFDHIKQGYYGSLTQLNPNKIVPEGPRENVERL